MEYASGGELFNHIVKKRRLDEQEAIFFFYQIINGLEHIHKNNIVHRDMKPENLLLSENKLLKIIDFGLSNQYKPGQLLQTPCGSPCYAAPEMILGRKYSGLMVDIWSSGIILYAMVCGFLPFEDKNNDKLYKKILECKYEWPDHVSPNCKDLIKKLLTVNPSKRIKLDEIKSHPFLKLGESILGKDVVDAALNDKRLIEYVLNQMEEMGLNRSEVKLNIENNKHNNITTTYDLLMNRARAKYDWIIMNYENNKTQEIENPSNNAANASNDKNKEDTERNTNRNKENAKESENKFRNPSGEVTSKTRAENISDIIKNIKLDNTNKEEGTSSGKITIENQQEKYNKEVSYLNPAINNPSDHKEKLHQGLTNKINIILKDFNENLNSRQKESSAANDFKKENSEDPPNNNRQANKKSTSVSKNYKKEFGKRINPAINIIPLNIKGIIEKNKNDSNNIIVGTPVLTEINRINDKIKTKRLQPDVINSTLEGSNFKKKIDTSLTYDTSNQINSFREKGINIFSKKLNSLIPKNEINLHDHIISNRRDASISKDEIQKSSKNDKKNKSVNGISLDSQNSKIIDVDVIYKSYHNL
jgi:serine/threonine protein kinase